MPKLLSSDVILAFGDSLTYGTGTEATEAYPTVLERLSGFKVVNAGVPGEVTAKGLARLPQVLEDVQPALMILCHGGNDLLRKTGEPAAADNLRAMVRLAQQQGVSVMLVGVPKPSILLNEPAYYQQVADEFHVPILTGVFSKILKRPSMKSDAIHPNNKGYKVLAENIYVLMGESGLM